MKKIISGLLLVCIIAAAAVIPAFAGHAKDTEHGIIYYVWNNGADAGDNKSGDEPLNQLELDYGEIDGCGGVKMTYSPNGAVKDPYYSLSKIDFNEYKYCSVKYYISTVKPESTTGASFYIRFSGGSGYANIGNEHNKWATSVISFKTDDGSSFEWSDKNCGITWFRINCRLEEGENMYVKWIAFFKTQSEAENFAGFADFSAYEAAKNKAVAIDRRSYQSYEALDNALSVDVSKYLFASEQNLVDDATSGILNAIDALVPLEGKPADYVEPSVKVIPIITDVEETTEETNKETTAKSVETQQATEPIQTDPASETDGEQKAEGCKASVGAAALLVCFAAATTLTRRKEK